MGCGRRHKRKKKKKLTEHFSEFFKEDFAKRDAKLPQKDSYVLVRVEDTFAPKQIRNGRVYATHAKDKRTAWSNVLFHMRGQDLDLHDVILRNSKAFKMMPLVDYTAHQLKENEGYKVKERAPVYKSIKKKEWQSELFPPEMPD